ncbi:MAG: Fe-S cluster assembly protein SufD [Actinomycetota bacterium]|nr:Fe-S cluster assembly protein SufD [Actinomycetota bacterium]
MTIAPPIDLSPRLTSLDPAVFGVPTGREVEWRFAPLDVFSKFFQAIDGAGSVTARGATEFVRNVDVLDLHSSWLPTDRPMAIARSLVQQAVVIDIPKDRVIEDPIMVDLQGSAASCYQHVEVNVGAFSSAVVVLQHDMDRDVCGAIVVTVGDGAKLTMLSVVAGDTNAVHISNWHTTTGRDSAFVGCTVTTGGRAVRISPSVTYRAPGGSAELLGVFLADSEQYLEHRIFVEHEQPHCTSRVTYKGALSGAGAHTVWVGDVLVRRGATGTDTYEMNRNLLLTEGPRADSVPNLELETGDIVGAGHASATGRFDDEQLFYLQARGIPEHQARQLVVRGFFAEVLARLNQGQLRDAMMRLISHRLGLPEQVSTSGFGS